ncbi:MAG: glycosyltransferase family 29 protein [Paracoccus sp. (in: a-proteobacteria)]|nr:glycosyltransferase family 29 protein [Paracoccus sp. (in: a-proteobacteria)]
MNRLRFYLARTLRSEPALQNLSVAQSDWLDMLQGQSVALIGNARALTQARHGADIDAHDTVIRINRAPMPAALSHGTRTDILALATSLPDADRARLNPARLAWFSHKRKRLDYATAKSAGFYLHPLPDYAGLKARLGAPPTTGAMLIDLLSRAPLARLTLYGFDFFASQSLSGSRSADQTPHDFAAESALVVDLMRADPRITRIA